MYNDPGSDQSKGGEDAQTDPGRISEEEYYKEETADGEGAATQEYDDDWDQKPPAPPPKEYHNEYTDEYMDFETESTEMSDESAEGSRKPNGINLWPNSQQSKDTTEANMPEMGGDPPKGVSKQVNNWFV